jgi:AraC-like DNA-binding protein/ligand-binding sensor protein
MSHITADGTNDVCGSSCSIINKREIEPLLDKARDLIKTYEKALGCTVMIVDQYGCSARNPGYRRAVSFCSLCKKCSPVPEQWQGEAYPCTDMHLEAINKSRRLGGAYIYTCRLGFVYWTSPVYSGGRYAGSLVAGRILGIERDKAEEKIFAICGKIMSREDIRGLLKTVPVLTCREIKAQAQLLLICARKISEGGENDAGQDGHRRLLSAETPAQADPNGLLEKERVLLASLRRGDNTAAIKILDGMLRELNAAHSGDYEMVRTRSIELVVFLSRAALRTGREFSLLDANARYFKWIHEARNIKELSESLRTIMEQMAGHIFFFRGIRHASALRRAVRFIWANYTRKLSLREISAASGLSAPYFSTIFKEEMGENLSAYLNRLRVEKAAAMLTETELPLQIISQNCGFEDQSWFSKIFKHFTGLSPGKFREQGGIFRLSPKDLNDPPEEPLSGDLADYAT